MAWDILGKGVNPTLIVAIDPTCELKSLLFANEPSIINGLGSSRLRGKAQSSRDP